MRNEFQNMKIFYLVTEKNGTTEGLSVNGVGLQSVSVIVERGDIGGVTNFCWCLYEHPSDERICNAPA